MIKPILFSTPMVQAILDGRKTMTRRVVNPQPVDGFVDPICGFLCEKTHYGGHIVNPKYSRGDILWVRETWADEGQTTSYDNDGTIIHHVHYYAYKEQTERMKWGRPARWRPSIFMPRKAARIWLRVTDVRVELVQDITNDDAIKEGCSGAECDCLLIGRSWMGCESCMNTGWQEPPVVEFMQLWDDLNAKRGYGWNSNPYVWVISFERCEKPQDDN